MRFLFRPRRRRHGFWGPPPRRRAYHRPRRHTNVRVGGCCLPIPLGVVVAGALGVRAAAGRRAR